MNAYIVAAKRTAVGKAPRGLFRFKRADELAAETIKYILENDLPDLSNEQIDDVIVGNAMPEAEQGLNVARLISLMALDTEKVSGMTVNRYCASGLETIAIASAKIHSGMADCIIAGGTETMSPIPMGGWRVVPNYEVSKNHPDWYWGMGNTAEAVAEKYNISRTEQDEFAAFSHEKSLKALSEDRFKDQIVPIDIEENYYHNGKMKSRKYTVDTDEGPRKGSTPEVLSKLKPVFAQGGSVTAGNSSQMSDGAAFTVIMSERLMNELGLKPIAKLVSYSAAGLDPKYMGMGPVYAVPKALKSANLELKDIDLIELNEAFASQSVAVMKELGLDNSKVNVNGGAISLGHPLGCTGSKLTVQVLDELKKRDQKYGMVTMCVGTGQGAAGIFELLN